MKKYPVNNSRKTSTWEKNKDLFQRLIENNEFQKYVFAFRKKWKIPVSGYDKDYFVWEQMMEKLNDDYYDKNQKYTKFLIHSKKQSLKHGITWPEYKGLFEKLHHNNPINSCQRDINFILEMLKISPNWYHNIKQYLLLNTLKSMYFPVGISFSETNKFSPDTIKITIDAHTTWQDIFEKWPDIERAQKKLNHKRYLKYQPYPSRDLHRKLYELKKSDIPLKEISKITGVPYNYINIYIRRYLKSINRK